MGRICGFAVLTVYTLQVRVGPLKARNLWRLLEQDFTVQLLNLLFLSAGPDRLPNSCTTLNVGVYSAFPDPFFSYVAVGMQLLFLLIRPR